MARILVNLLLINMVGSLPNSRRFPPQAIDRENFPDPCAAEQFLERNQFGLAVVVAYTGMKADTDEIRVLTQARAMMVRDYPAQNFRLDDTRLKTIRLGKNKEAGDSSEVQILIYPPASRVSPGGSLSRSSDGRTIPRSSENGFGRATTVEQ